MKKRILCAMIGVFFILSVCCSCQNFSEEESSAVQTTAATTMETTTVETTAAQTEMTEATTASPVVIESRADAYEALFRYIMENGTSHFIQTRMRNIHAAKADRAVRFKDARTTKNGTAVYAYFMGASTTENKITLIADHDRYFVTITIPEQGDIFIEYQHQMQGEDSGFYGASTLKEGSRFGNSKYWDTCKYYRQVIDSEEAIFNTLIHLSHLEKYFTEKNIGIVFEDLGFTFPSYDTYAMQFIYPR